jgi:hypothetical protein
MDLVSEVKVICTHCGADAGDGFRVETTSYQVYERKGDKLRKSRDQRGVAALAKCLPCGKLLGVPVEKLTGEAV